MKNYPIILMMFLLIVLNGCNKSSPSQNIESKTLIPLSQTKSYPPPDQNPTSDSNANSIIPTPQVQNVQTTPYPPPILNIPLTKIPINAVPFKIDKPVLEGSTHITGKGTAGVPIIIFNVTKMGEILGQGTIQSDSTFDIPVPPLEKGTRIGIGIADLTGTKWIVEDFQNPSYNGDEPMQVPMVGFFFDTAMVQGK